MVLEGPSAEAQNRPVHPEVSAILEEESRVPWGGLFRCVALSVIVLLCSLFKGGEHDSVIGVKCGNPMCVNGLTLPCLAIMRLYFDWIFRYWVLFFVPFFFIAATMVWQGIQMRIQYDKKVQLHYPFQDGDIMWNGSNVFLYVLHAFSEFIAFPNLAAGAPFFALLLDFAVAALALEAEQSLVLSCCISECTVNSPDC